MKKLLCVAAAICLTQAAFAAAPVTPPEGMVRSDAMHGGGCRKSSPAGQCCHAGSQPLHCHK